MMANDILPDELEDEEGDPLKYIDLIRHASEDILVILDAAIVAVATREGLNTQEAIERGSNLPANRLSYLPAKSADSLASSTRRADFAVENGIFWPERWQWLA